MLNSEKSENNTLKSDEMDTTSHSFITPRIPFAAYKGDNPYIFISYAHKDSAMVYPIITQFNDQSYNIWYDEGIEPGIEWPEEIANALNSSSLFVVFITPNSVASENVRNEINFALAKKLPFIAIYLCETSLTPGLQLQIGSKQDIRKYILDDDSFRRKYSYSFDSIFHKPEKEPELPIPEDQKNPPHTDRPAVIPTTPPATGAIPFVCDIIRKAACEKLGLPEDKPLEQKHINVVTELTLFADAFGKQYLACSKDKERLMVYKKESQPVFFFERGSITDLSDFSYFRNLQDLRLIFHTFSDLEPLANLPLKILDLSCNQLADLSPLGELTQMTNLSLDFTTFNSLAPLGKAKTLRFLSMYDISYQAFHELCQLDLPNLQTLHIPNSKLESLAGISNLKSLTWLSINDGVIFEFDEIAKLKNLSVLALARTKCFDFSFLKELPLLNTLSVDEEQKAQIIEQLGEKPPYLK